MVIYTSHGGKAIHIIFTFHLVKRGGNNVERIFRAESIKIPIKNKMGHFCTTADRITTNEKKTCARDVTTLINDV